MTELSRGEIVATLMGRELSKRLARAHKRITETQSRTASELSAIRAVEDSYARSIDAVRESVGALSAADASLTRTAEEQRALLGLTTDAMAEIDARLRANEATDQAQDAQLVELDIRVADVAALARVPGPKGDKGDKGDTGPPGRSGRSSVGGGAGQATTILSGGTTVGTRGTLNFVSGATVTDDAANERVNITVSGGGGNVNSVSVSSGLSITGTSDLTITNTGVRSLAGSGISVSSSTGAVTITAPSVTAGTGITVAGSGTTALTVSATGVQSLTAGNGISVSGTTTPTVSASLAAGTGIGISGTTTLSVSNTGVTSLAGTGISVSASTGSVTVTPTYAAPTALTIGGTVVTGAAASVANSAHVHAMPGSATAGASAVGDTAATGTATTVALSDHRHSREAFGTPVVVNGQTTTLATGSLTTLARADHVHTMSNTTVLLATTTFASVTASYTFSSIRAGFSALELIWAAQSEMTSAVVDALNIRVNGNTGSVYNSSFGNQTSAFVGYINSRTANYYNAPSAGRLVFTDISTTTRKMSGFSFYGYNDSATAYGSGTWMARPVYETTGSVLSSLTILATYGNMSTGSTFWLYGIP